MPRLARGGRHGQCEQHADDDEHGSEGRGPPRRVGGDLEVGRESEDAGEAPGQQPHLVVPQRQHRLEPDDRDDRRGNREPCADGREHGAGRAASPELGRQRPAGGDEHPDEQSEGERDVDGAAGRVGPEPVPVPARTREGEREQREAAAQHDHAADRGDDGPRRATAAQQHGRARAGRRPTPRARWPGASTTGTRSARHGCRRAAHRAR